MFVCVMYNAMQAMEVVHVMRENGIEPNAYTYTSLMTAAVEKMDSHTVERVFSLMKTQVSTEG